MAKKKPASTLTDKHIKAICAAIRLGCPIHVAASIAGIDRKTLYNWRQTGKRPTAGLHRKLVAEMEKAGNEFIETNLRALQVHSLQNWQTSAWLLERRHPEYFAKPSDRRELDDLKNELKLIRGEIAKHQPHAG